MDDYRMGIIAILERHALPGEDLERALLEGAPPKIDETAARFLADWLRSSADQSWGFASRHSVIGDEITALVDAGEKSAERDALNKAIADAVWGPRLIGESNNGQKNL